MTGDERHNSFLAGYELGLAMRCHLDTQEADHEARHALVRPLVAALVADLNRRGVGDNEQLQANRRARQVASCERQKRDALPWPDEVAS